MQPAIPSGWARLAPSGQFNDQERAREELRAELASAMLGGELGLPMSQQQIDSHAAYLSSWHDLLANDPNEILGRQRMRSGLPTI